LIDCFPESHVRDFCIMEEPEHLTWHHKGKMYTDEFRYVLGIIHTNYSAYASTFDFWGPIKALFLKYMNKWACRSYCHRVIKLSNAIHSLPHSVTCNVHGVRSRFLTIGRHARKHPEDFTKGAYFLGKALWEKGYRQLLNLMIDHYERENEPIQIDMYGDGADMAAITMIQRHAAAFAASYVHGKVIDHADEHLHAYKVFVNPSVSDVLCTAVAEALAMGKIVVLYDHPSNDFFRSFANCLIFKDAKDFSKQVKAALEMQPKPLSDEEAYRLSWSAATDRLYVAARSPPDRDEMTPEDILAGSVYRLLNQMFVHDPESDAPETQENDSVVKKTPSRLVVLNEEVSMHGGETTETRETASRESAPIAKAVKPIDEPAPLPLKKEAAPIKEAIKRGEEPAPLPFKAGETSVKQVVKKFEEPTSLPSKKEDAPVKDVVNKATEPAPLPLEKEDDNVSAPVVDVVKKTEEPAPLPLQKEEEKESIAIKDVVNKAPEPAPLPLQIDRERPATNGVDSSLEQTQDSQKVLGEETVVQKPVESKQAPAPTPISETEVTKPVLAEDHSAFVTAPAAKTSTTSSSSKSHKKKTKK